MRFTRLEVHGFKSFARKTALELGDGITAIVGPNGSGKSNLADAVRWVLGEQSGKLLRTRRLEDVIFGGSDARSPQGMAEVTLILDNSDGRLPLDFSEVTVTRRAYRSGESEYLINGRRMRLRDVQDLFLRAQLGQNTYSIIGQGAIEDLLMLRPEERRELLEEAADVKRYRLRLREAQRMLERTLANLDRASLVRSELEPQVRRLERLAQRAQRRAELSSQLQAHLRLWYGGLWLRARQALREAEGTLEQGGTRRQTLSMEIEQLRYSLEAQEEALADSEAHLEELRSQQSQLLSRHSDLSLNQRMDSERSQAAEELAASLAEEIEDLERQCQLARDEAAQASSRLEDLAREEAKAQEELAASSRAISEAEAEATRLSTEVARLNGVLAAEQSAAAEVERSRERLDKEEKAVEQELASIARQREELAASLKAATEELRRQQDEASSLAERQHAAKQARDAAASAADKASQSDAEGRLAALESELRALRERRRWLEDVSSQPATDSATGAVLAAASDGHEKRLEGIVGLVSRLVQAPEGLEAAIEAALDYQLNAIVVERARDAEAAIDLLTEMAAGRATFLPLDSLREDRPLQLVAERGVIGVAAKLVRCERRYRPLVDTLLGRVVVVEDLATARRILQRRIGSVVTRTGELLRPIGSLTGGRGSTSPSQGPLARERELAELTKKEEQLAAELDACRDGLAAAASRQEETQRELAAREEEVAAAEEAARRAAAGVAERKRRIERLRGEWRWQQRLEQEALRHREAIKEHRALLQATSQDTSSNESTTAHELAALEEKAADVREALARAISANSDLQAQVARSQVEAEGVRAQQKRAQQTIEHLEGQIEERRERMLQAQRQALTLRVGNAKRDDELLTLEELIERGEREIRDREVELAERQRGRADLAARLASREQELASLTGDEASRQEVERRREELANLRSMAAAEALELPEDEEVIRRWLEEAAIPEAHELEENIATLRRQLQNTGSVDEEALQEYEPTKARYEELAAQIEDLQSSETSLNKAIAELEGIIRSRFQETFDQVNAEFARYFNIFFGGGTSRLVLTSSQDGSLDGGIDIVAQPPGKRLQNLAQLSGGERSLAATSLVFALLHVNPVPFCVLDEVDAALDDANIGRFVETVRSLAASTQFIIITHNHGTIEIADNIFGVTMGPDSVSRILSLRLNGHPKNPSG